MFLLAFAFPIASLNIFALAFIFVHSPRQRFKELPRESRFRNGGRQRVHSSFDIRSAYAVSNITENLLVYLLARAGFLA